MKILAIFHFLLDVNISVNILLNICFVKVKWVWNIMHKAEFTLQDQADCVYINNQDAMSLSVCSSCCQNFVVVVVITWTWHCFTPPFLRIFFKESTASQEPNYCNSSKAKTPWYTHRNSYAFINLNWAPSDDLIYIYALCRQKWLAFHCRYTFYQFMHSLGIKPMTLRTGALQNRFTVHAHHSLNAKKNTFKYSMLYIFSECSFIHSSICYSD